MLWFLSSFSFTSTIVFSSSSSLSSLSHHNQHNNHSHVLYLSLCIIEDLHVKRPIGSADHTSATLWILFRFVHVLKGQNWIINIKLFQKILRISRSEYKDKLLRLPPGRESSWSCTCWTSQSRHPSLRRWLPTPPPGSLLGEENILTMRNLLFHF